MARYLPIRNKKMKPDDCLEVTELQKGRLHLYPNQSTAL